MIPEDAIEATARQLHWSDTDSYAWHELTPREQESYRREAAFLVLPDLDARDPVTGRDGRDDGRPLVGILWAIGLTIAAAVVFGGLIALLVAVLS